VCVNLLRTLLAHIYAPQIHPTSQHHYKGFIVSAAVNLNFVYVKTLDQATTWIQGSNRYGYETRYVHV